MSDDLDDALDFAIDAAAFVPSPFQPIAVTAKIAKENKKARRRVRQDVDELEKEQEEIIDELEDEERKADIEEQKARRRAFKATRSNNRSGKSKDILTAPLGDQIPAETTNKEILGT